MAKIRRKNGRRRLLIMLVVVLSFAWYLAVGVIMSYMKISMLPKIFGLTLPSFLLGAAVTLLVLDIRYGTHIRRRKKSRSEAAVSSETDDEQQGDEDV
ncbi:MAG: hypothetical protein IJM32_04545 [Ruminococcus sp.]|nr:hypothetical protein [Ruminococcus sp.]